MDSVDRLKTLIASSFQDPPKMLSLNLLTGFQGHEIETFDPPNSGVTLKIAPDADEGVKNHKAHNRAPMIEENPPGNGCPRRAVWLVWG
jgi:hypothetical protein